MSTTLIRTLFGSEQYVSRTREKLYHDSLMLLLRKSGVSALKTHLIGARTVFWLTRPPLGHLFRAFSYRSTLSKVMKEELRRQHRKYSQLGIDRGA